MRKPDLRKTFNVTIKAVDDEKKTVRAVVSTDSIDRDGEIILPSAFSKDLEIYRQNPVLLWNHPIHSFDRVEPDDVIGRAVDVRVTDEGLEATFEYAVDVNPRAELVFNMVRDGFLRAFSIGAIGKEAVFAGSPEETIKALPEHAQSALKKGDVFRVHTRMELIEISQVMVGSNREALARQAKILARGYGLEEEPMATKGERLGARVRELREGKEMIQAELAAELPIDTATLGRIETGDIIRPRQNVLSALASALDVSTSSLEDLADADQRTRASELERAPHQDALQDAIERAKDMDKTEELLTKMVELLKKIEEKLVPEVIEVEPEEVVTEEKAEEAITELEPTEEKPELTQEMVDAIVEQILG